MAEMSVGQFCWNELATTDVEKAKNFYQEVFGWEYEDINVNDTTYTIIKKNNDGFGGIWRIPDNLRNKIPPHWMAYILVVDAEKALQKAKQTGATEVKPVMQIGDMGRMAIFVDPTGAHIAVWQPLNASNK